MEEWRRRDGVGVIGYGAAGGLKIHEVQGDRAVEHGAAVVVEAGLGLHVVLVLKGSEVVGGGLYLRVAHAVADEQEDVFRGGAVSLSAGFSLGGERGGAGGHVGRGGGRVFGRGLAAGGEHHHDEHGGENQCGYLFHVFPPLYF